LSAVTIQRRVPAAWLAVFLVWAIGAGAGCSPGRQRVAAPNPDVRGGALIEAGNTAFRAGDYQLAARRYAAAAVHRPDDPAAYYGLGMSLARLGRDEDARAAYAHARELARRQE
jgi:Flp pilus assembly protein TadD